MATVADLQIRVDSTSAKTAERDLGGLTSAAGLAEKAVAGLAAAWATMQLGSFVKEVTILAARFDTMEVVMNRAGSNAGYTARQMRELENALQDTGISMLESRNALTQLATANIDLSRATELARIAQDVAKVGNLNSSDAFQRMIHGIKSGQTEVLRTMGINVVFEDSYKKLALQLHKTAEALTPLEKMQARVNVVAAEGAKYAGIYEDALGTAGAQAKSMERYIENLQVKLGQTFQPIYSGAVVALTNAIKGSIAWIDRNKNSLDALGLTLENTRQAFGDLFRTVSEGESSVQWMELLRGSIGGVGMAAAFASDAFRGWKIFIGEAMSSMFESLARGTEAMVRFYQAMPGGGKSAGEAAKILEFLTSVSVKYDTMVRKTGAASSAVDAWMKANREAEKIAKGDRFNPDGPSALDMAGKAQSLEEPLQGKGNKAFQSFLDNLKEQVATFDMGKTAVEAYKASLMGLNESQAEQVKTLLNQIDAHDWEAQRVKDSRDAENALTEALEAQSRARIELLTQQRKQLEDEGARVRESVMDAEERRAAGLARLDLLLRGNVIGLETYNRKLQEIEKSGTSAFSTLLNAVDLFAQHGADAFTNFAMTGKFVWKDMINSIIADLIRLQSQKAFVQLGGYLLGMIGGATTQSVSFSSSSDYMNLPSRGGSSTAGSFSMPSAGKGGASGAVQITNIVNINDGKVTSESKTNGGQQASDINREMEGMMNGWAVKNMRPGGLLNPVGA